jgi:glycosyltransferase involved in cell wall biosynthesis
MRCPTLSGLPPPPPGKTGWPWTKDSPQLSDTMADGRPWPEVSIITPSYNQAPFLEETIRSVLLQGYPNLEYIVIDGGSTDQSVDIIRKYQKWLGNWVCEPDNGQADAINKGWQMSTGKILAYLNSDDTYCPGAMAVAASYFLQYPEVGMVYGDCNIVDDKGALIKNYKLHEMSYGDILYWFNYIIPQPTVFLRREVIATVGILNANLHYAMDYDLWLRVGLRFKIKYIPKFLATARLHPTAKTVAVPINSFLESLHVVEQFFSQDLPPEISVLKSKTFAAHYLRKADFFFRIGEMSQARAWTIKALLLRAPSFLVPRAVVIYLMSFLGLRLTSWLRKTKQRWHSVFERRQASRFRRI